MMRLKRILLALIALASTMLLSACGPDCGNGFELVTTGGYYTLIPVYYGKTMVMQPVWQPTYDCVKVSS